jgi:hypothetical protein
MNSDFFLGNGNEFGNFPEFHSDFNLGIKTDYFS